MIYEHSLTKRYWALWVLGAAGNHGSPEALVSHLLFAFGSTKAQKQHQTGVPPQHWKCSEEKG